MVKLSTETFLKATDAIIKLTTVEQRRIKISTELCQQINQEAIEMN